jgi:hypothetical protein
MSQSRNALRCVAAVLAMATMPTAFSAEPATPETASASQPPIASEKKMIQSAMRAAPKKVSESATIIVMGSDGTMRTLRQGTNGFTCMPDNPTTPGPDPMCLDKAAMEWANAWMGHKSPPDGKVGLIYMLSGGTDASNTDPYATKPDANNHWVKTGPHIMVVGADPGFYNLYPRGADPDTSIPYVMWAGTPYQHLMIPVR